jgi:serpin B
MKKIMAFLVSMLLLAVMAGCAQPAAAAEQKSNKPRETAPAVTQSDVAKLADGNSQFALSLYQILKTGDSNFFYSPYSISEALAMTYGGARGQTEAQMASALQFLLSQSQLHAAFNQIDIELAKRGQGAQGATGEGFKLNVVNAIWGQKGFKFTQSYLDLLAQNYGAGMRIQDFQNAAEASRQTINEWVADQTANKITDLLPQGSITDLTRLVLTNAIYFNAAWATQFDKGATRDGQFTLLGGGNVTASMMKQNNKSYQYAEGPNYQAIELPYDGQDLSMIVLLPQNGQYAQFETALNNQKLNDIMAQLQPAIVNLTMPKFKIESDLALAATLKTLGMTDAFDPTKADLSGMDGKKDLYISDVVHKSYVAVDEAGTEAAAATGVVVSTTSMPVNVKDFTMDSPFIFLIRDNPTGSILFMGRVLDPSK